MPTELEQNSSILFTDEAETALRKVLTKTERRLRTKAVGEAARLRGWPPEVTGSDVLKAERELTSIEEPSLESLDSRYRSRRLQQMMEFEEVRLKKRSSALSLLDVLAKVYMVIGAIFTVAGFLYAPLYKMFISLSHDPYWKRGFFITGAGLLTLIASFSFRMLGSRMYQLRMVRNEFPKRSVAQKM